MTRARIRHLSRAVLAGSIVGAILGLACCADDEAAPPAVTADANVTPVFGGDAAGPPPVVVDAEVPPADVCGDRSGLQVSSPWPLRGGCPTRAGWSSMSGPKNATVSVRLPLLGSESSPAAAGPSGIV